MSSTKDESKDRNICRIGCGRPGQRDYGWKGSAFNCCFGTVACLVEHKRPIRHASVAWSCEYLPDQWNAPLSLHLPYKLPALTLIFTALSLFLLWSDSPGGWQEDTHASLHTPYAKCVGSYLTTSVCSLLVLFCYTASAQVHSLQWCNASFKGEGWKVSLIVSVPGNKSKGVAPISSEHTSVQTYCTCAAHILMINWLMLQRLREMKAPTLSNACNTDLRWYLCK